MGDTEGYGSASTPDSVTEKAVHQPGSNSQDGVWRDRQHRHWERSATGMYPLTTTIQYLPRKHNERGFGRMGEWNQHRREDGDEPEIRRRYNTARWDKEELIELVERVRRASEKAGLYLNVGKTKVSVTDEGVCVQSGKRFDLCSHSCVDVRRQTGTTSDDGYVVMEDDVMLGRMNGARRRGRPRQRWLDTLMGYSSGATISNMRRYARDRAGWRGAATDVARSRMRLDGTR